MNFVVIAVATRTITMVHRACAIFNICPAIDCLWINTRPLTSHSTLATRHRAITPLLPWVPFCAAAIFLIACLYIRFIQICPVGTHKFHRGVACPGSGVYFRVTIAFGPRCPIIPYHTLTLTEPQVTTLTTFSFFIWTRVSIFLQTKSGPFQFMEATAINNTFPFSPDSPLGATGIWKRI